MNSMSQEVTLLVANSNEADYSFRYVQLPEILKEHSYTILDSSDGSVFININHLKPSSPMGTIYISDSTGSRFYIKLFIIGIRNRWSLTYGQKRVNAISKRF